jgi:predicted secreted Zn-dependent protease
MTETELPINEMVAVYRKIRAAIDEREEKHTEAISTLKEQLDTVGNKLLAICNEQNLDSIKTPDGTITRRVTARYWTSDWETMCRIFWSSASTTAI